MEKFSKSFPPWNSFCPSAEILVWRWRKASTKPECGMLMLPPPPLAAWQHITIVNFIWYYTCYDHQNSNHLRLLWHIIRCSDVLSQSCAGKSENILSKEIVSPIHQPRTSVESEPCSLYSSCPVLSKEFPLIYCTLLFFTSRHLLRICLWFYAPRHGGYSYVHIAGAVLLSWIEIQVCIHLFGQYRLVSLSIITMEL